MNAVQIWTLVGMAALTFCAIAYVRQHYTFKRCAHQQVMSVSPQQAYEQMMVDLHELEKLPSPRERAQAIEDAQHRYFQSIEVKKAS